jgi:hypothetical protein
MLATFDKEESNTENITGLKFVTVKLTAIRSDCAAFR